MYYVDDWSHRCDIYLYASMLCSLQNQLRRTDSAFKNVKDEKSQILGTLADKAAQVSKWADQQSKNTDQQLISCENKNLETGNLEMYWILKFKHLLGPLFAAEVNQYCDIKARMTMAMTKWAGVVVNYKIVSSTMHINYDNYLFDTPNLHL